MFLIISAVIYEYFYSSAAWRSALVRLTLWCTLLMGLQADEDNTEFISFQTVCNRLAIPKYPDFYIQSSGFFFDLQQCPQYTTFDAGVCGCVHTYNDPVPTMAVITDIPAPSTPGPTSSKTTNPTTTTATTTTTTTASTTTATTTTTTTTTPTPLIPSTSRPIQQTTVVHKYGHKSIKRTRAPPKNMCEGCTFDRGVGYNSHVRDCDKYVMCYQSGLGGQLMGQVRQCGVGQYWDQHLLTCMPSRDVYCNTDKCALDPTLDTHQYESDCRGYWKCEYGVSIGHCCPKGQGYKPGIGCVRDLSCNTMCDTVEDKPGCDKISVPEDPVKFKQRISGHGFVSMRCAAGTVFNETQCMCQTDTRTHYSRRRIGCKKELDLDFSSSLKDISGNGVHVDSLNVTLDNGSACFHGNSALLIPRFSNVDIGANLEIHIKYKFSSVAGSQKDEMLQALVFNGDCAMDSSVVVASSPDKTTFGLRNKYDMFKTVEFHPRTQERRWIDAKFSFHRNRMKIKQNGSESSRVHIGSIARSLCGLKIGWGTGFKSFNGCIAKIPQRSQWRITPT